MSKEEDIVSTGEATDISNITPQKAATMGEHI